MKRALLCLFAFCGILLQAQAQENPLHKGFGFGFQLNQYQNDFGIGLSLTSPHFAHDHIAIRTRGNMMYYEHVKDGEMTWTPYMNLTVGLIGVGGYVGENIRLYGEGGLVTIFPASGFSTKSAEFGGYGLFGFEFFMQNSFNYFIELGGIGTGATANKLPANPIYSNGFLISTGFRTYLK